MTSLDSIPASAAAQPDARKVFWAAYLNWLAVASDEELHELTRALDRDYVGEVQPLAKAIRAAMHQEVILRALPSGLVRQLKAVNWPGEQASA